MSQDSTQNQPGSSSIPIRAPLTVDSDSEYNLSSNNNYNYSRSSSFSSSTSSSVDISSFNDENNDFATYPHDEIVLEQSRVEKYELIRPFVKYPDGNEVKECVGFDKNEIFRPFVKYPDGNEVKECVGFDKNEMFRPFVKYPDGNNVKDCSGSDRIEIFRPSVKYPDGDNVKDCSGFDKVGVFRPFANCPDGNKSNNAKGCDGDDKVGVFRPIVKDCGGFDKGGVFRPFVIDPCAESSSSGNLGVPVARLSGDYDSDSDVDSVDGVGESVVMAPKVRIFSGYEGDDGVEGEGVFSGDDSSCISELNKSIEDEGCKVECLNEVVKVSESDETSFDLGRSGAEIVSYSGNDIDIETDSGSEQEVVFDCCGNQSKKTVDQKEREMVGMEVDMAPKVRTFGNGDTSHIDELDNSMRVCISDESTGDEGCKVECLNEVHELSELNEMINTVNECEPEVVDVYRTESKNRLSEVEEEMVVMKVVVATKAGAFSRDEGEDINDIEELKGLNGSTRCSVPADTIENERYMAECLNDVVKLSEPDEPSFDLEKIIARNVSDSGNEIESESATISGNEQESLVKMQPVKSKFLKLVRFLGLLNEFDSHMTILAIGKTGIGKSATINSIFSENKASTNAFDPGTTIIQEIVGTIEGIELRVIDTPGLKCSPFERSYNLKILKSIKRLAKKHTPDVMLYVDRLDTHTRGDDDSHLLRLITSSLGSSVWRKCIIALTHATSSPTDESLRGFVYQRCHLIREQIRNHGGTNEHMVNPVWLVENHVTYKHDKSRLLEFSSYLRHNIVLDDGLDSLVCFDRANEDERDQVPPFEPLSKQRDVVNCSVERRKAYFEECSYRVKLLGTKHWSVACRLYS